MFRHSTSTVRMQFLSEWEGNEDKGPVFEKAYEVIVPRDIKVRHEAYWLVFHIYEQALLREYADTCATACRAKNQGSEIRTFYSALCVCDLGFKDDNLCGGRTCGICCAVKSSFRSFAFGRTFMEGRQVVD
jgi:hypothetical protein